MKHDYFRGQWASVGISNPEARKGRGPVQRSDKTPVRVWNGGSAQVLALTATADVAPRIRISSAGTVHYTRGEQGGPVAAQARGKRARYQSGL